VGDRPALRLARYENGEYGQFALDELSRRREQGITSTSALCPSAEPAKEMPHDAAPPAAVDASAPHDIATAMEDARDAPTSAQRAPHESAIREEGMHDGVDAASQSAFNTGDEDLSFAGRGVGRSAFSVEI
jgi:hypothetical protein